MFLELQIIILEWFLKDHRVTLKIGIIMLKIQHILKKKTDFKLYFMYFLNCIWSNKCNLCVQLYYIILYNNGIELEQWNYWQPVSRQFGRQRTAI